MIENNIKNEENGQTVEIMAVKENNVKRKKITAIVLPVACILAVSSAAAVLSTNTEDVSQSADISDYAYTTSSEAEAENESTEKAAAKSSVKNPEIPAVTVPNAKPESKAISGSSSVESKKALEYSPALYDVSVKSSQGTDFISASGTVEDAVLKSGIDFDEYDIITPSLDTPLSDDLSITVRDVTYTKLTTRVTVPYETESVADSSLYEGETVLVTDGKEGEIHRQYYVKKVDGEEVARKLISEEVVSESVNEVYAYGTKVKEEIPEISQVSEEEIAQPVQEEIAAESNEAVENTEAVESDITSGGEAAVGNYAGNVSAISEFTVPEDLLLDENGTPINYVRTVTGKSCAYTANPGALMSTGKAVEQGYVAVNPNVIPYGSKLYIVADDGEVYGYAIAADTGGSVMKNHIVVDLFMWSYDDCIQWGAKNVTIYIIEEG